MSKTFNCYLMGVKGDPRQVVIDAIGRNEENFEDLIDPATFDEEDGVSPTPEGVADYILQHAELMLDDLLKDPDVAEEVDTTELREDCKLGGSIAAESEQNIKRLGEYKAWLLETAASLRTNGFTLYKVKLPSSSDIPDIFINPDYDNAYEWESNDLEFCFQPLFWDYLQEFVRR